MWRPPSWQHGSPLDSCEYLLRREPKTVEYMSRNEKLCRVFLAGAMLVAVMLAGYCTAQGQGRHFQRAGVSIH